jgi:hypothetical protein
VSARRSVSMRRFLSAVAQGQSLPGREAFAPVRALSPRHVRTALRAIEAGWVALDLEGVGAYKLTPEGTDHLNTLERAL